MPIVYASYQIYCLVTEVRVNSTLTTNLILLVAAVVR